MRDIFQLLYQKGLMDWSVINLGLGGLPDSSISLPSVDLIKNLATDELEKTEEPECIEPLAYLTMLGLHLDEEARRIIEKLAAAEDNSTVALRKLRAAALCQLLETPPLDYVYGLMAFTLFWTTWGISEDIPHAIQGLGNELTPDEYFTEARYSEAVDDHRKWLQTELTSLGIDSGKV